MKKQKMIRTLAFQSLSFSSHFSYGFFYQHETAFSRIKGRLIVGRSIMVGNKPNSYSSKVASLQGCFSYTSSKSSFSRAFGSSSVAASSNNHHNVNENHVEYPLMGKKALVTGSSGGIGSAIAKALAKHGASVMVHYNTRKEGAQQTCDFINNNNNNFGGKCDGMVQCDFRSPLAISKMMKSVVDDVWDGKFDILINNAGIVTKLAIEDDDHDLSSWHETMAVNLHAPLQLSKLAFARMKGQSGGGCIIMNSSIHGSISVEWMNSYAASKAALDSLTRGLSNEWAPHGVRVNAVAPGIVPVERTEAMLNTPQAQELWTPHLPVGRMGHVDDIAESVVYICQADWMTGSIVTVDGGMTARANMPMRPRPHPPNRDSIESKPISNDIYLDIH